MSVSDILVKVLGVILAVVGLALILLTVGINLFGIAGLANVWANLIVGVLLLGAGIFIVKGGNIVA